MMKIKLPYIGLVSIFADPKEPGHFRWLSQFGWHDCSRSEDAICRTQLTR